MSMDIWLPPKPAIIRPSPAEQGRDWRRYVRQKPNVAALHVNQLAGFGAGIAVQEPAIRYVGTYTATFTGGGPSTATFTIPGADQQYSGDTRQIFVSMAEEIAIMTGATIGGSAAAILSPADGGILISASRYVSGISDISVVFTTASASTEATGIVVFEAVELGPFWEASIGHGGIANQDGILQSIVDGFIFSTGMATGDATNLVWSGITEVADTDVGDTRVGAALNSTKQTTRTSTTVAFSASSAVATAFCIPPKTRVGVSGGFHRRATVTTSGTTATLSTYVDFNNRGNFTLVVAAAIESNQTINSATFNGNAMTSRGSVTNTAASPDLQLRFFSIELTDGAASGNIVITFSGSPSENCSISTWCLYGVGSFGTAVTTTGNGASPALSPTNASNGAILSAVVIGTGINPVASSVTNANFQAESNFGTGGSSIAIADIINDTSGAKSITYNLASSAQYAGVALPVSP
jgi:hypothetical protein